MQTTTVFTALYGRWDFRRHCDNIEQIDFLKGGSSTSVMSKLWTRRIILSINEEQSRPYALLRFQDRQVISTFKCFSISRVNIWPFNKIMNKDLFRQNLISLYNNHSNFCQYRITAEQLERNLGNLTTGNIREMNFSTCFMPSQVDETARWIIPDVFTSQAYDPVCTTANGNCLFNATSLAIWYSEQHATELRLCTCI